MAFHLHKKRDETKRNLQKGKKMRKIEEKEKKGRPLVNLMKERDLHCHAALVSVLGNLPIWI